MCPNMPMMGLQLDVTIILIMTAWKVCLNVATSPVKLIYTSLFQSRLYQSHNCETLN
jgi:hypothetical protein